MDTPGSIGDALALAVRKVVPTLLDCEPELEDYVAVTRTPNGNLTSQYVQRRSLPHKLIFSDWWVQESEVIGDAFKAEAPQHIDQLVGSESLGMRRLEAADWLRLVTSSLLKQTNFSPPGEHDIDSAVERVKAFISSPSIRLRFLAPLINFDSPTGASIVLPNGATIRQLDDAELTRVHLRDGGDLLVRAWRATLRPCHPAPIIQGTPAFMAPEQALVRAEMDGRADIYAAGCVAY